VEGIVEAGGGRGSPSQQYLPEGNPASSPASTAGRVRTILSTSCFIREATAMAMARYVFPVPRVRSDHQIAAPNGVDVTLLARLFGVTTFFFDEM